MINFDKKREAKDRTERCRVDITNNVCNSFAFESESEVWWFCFVSNLSPLTQTFSLIPNLSSE